MKIPQAITAFILALCLSAGGENLFGVFDFDLRGETEAEKIRSLDDIGFDGFSVNVTNPKNLKLLKKRLKAKPDLKILAGLFHTSCETPKSLNRPHLKKVLPVLAKHDAKLWLIIRGPKDEAKLLPLITEVADEAAKHKVGVSLYPHDNTGMETAEEALALLKKADRENLTISLHQCHELRAGNIDRLPEVIAAIRPHLDLVTICGSDRKMAVPEKGWRDAIKPLGEGDYDPKDLLRDLKEADFQGPIILHTYGLKKKPATHWQTSFDLYQKMVTELSTEKPKN